MATKAALEMQGQSEFGRARDALNEIEDAIG